LALWFSVILNVNLAILNMLPIPVLDGGHIVLGIIESIRRRPLNTRVLEMVQGVCTALIIGVIIYTTFYDFQDLPFVKKKLDQYEPQSKKDRDAP
jgi:regulator of sigma E protease